MRRLFLARVGLCLMGFGGLPHLEIHLARIYTNFDHKTNYSQLGSEGRCCALILPVGLWSYPHQGWHGIFTRLGVLVIRALLFWGPYWGPWFLEVPTWQTWCGRCSACAYSLHSGEVSQHPHQIHVVLPGTYRILASFISSTGISEKMKFAPDSGFMLDPWNYGCTCSWKRRAKEEATDALKILLQSRSTVLSVNADDFFTVTRKIFQLTRHELASIASSTPQTTSQKSSHSTWGSLCEPESPSSPLSRRGFKYRVYYIILDHPVSAVQSPSIDASLFVAHGLFKACFNDRHHHGCRDHNHGHHHAGPRRSKFPRYPGSQIWLIQGYTSNHRKGPYVSEGVWEFPNIWGPTPNPNSMDLMARAPAKKSPQLSL